MSTYARIVIEVEDGEYTVSSESGIDTVIPIILDWSGEWDFDKTQENIQELLDSGLDGPEIFRLIKKCINMFERCNP